MCYELFWFLCYLTPMLLEMGFIVSVRFTNFVPNQSGIVINFDNWEQNKPSANRRQIFVHVTLLRGIDHEFNMADERDDFGKG